MKNKNSKTLKIIAAQINTTVGAILANAQKIISTANEARDKYGAHAVIFPELSLSGYPPEDLLLRPELYQRIQEALSLIQKEVKDIYVILGYPHKIGKKCFNNAAVIYNGKIITTYSKIELPNYGVFDEKRYFNSGNKIGFTTINGVKIGISICEDLWFPAVIAKAKKHNVQLMLSLNASPFDIEKPLAREKIIKQRVKESKIPIVYINCIGGQDELVFDGGSMVMDANGKITQRAPFFTETLMPIEFNIAKKVSPLKNKIEAIKKTEELAYNALVLGVRDYIEKNSFKGAIIAVSGGIDSALTLAIAADALGKDKVETIFMPSRYTSQISKDAVALQTKNMGVQCHFISIEPVFSEFLKLLEPEFRGLPPDVTEENLQARCRATLLMAFSNKKKLIVLSTGNKSEMGVGYATLYGDMVGGFCVLKDVPKTLVYKLANYRNSISPVIPQSVIDRPPSAELASGQKDTDSLPPYEILDQILQRYIEQDQSRNVIIAAGFDAKTVDKVIKMVNRSEYKRRQSPVGIRITTRAFGRDRRYPITSGF
jgi:NAD+ synthase (glutamine-hydrolysing)